MNVRALAVLGGGAILSCGSSGGATLDLREPSAVALFHGYTVKNADLHPYVAVADAGKDELLLLDAVDGEAVLSPVLIRPLAIPVNPRPARLVAASLGDGGADLLVAVSSGSTELQVVRTWDAENALADDRMLDVADWVAGAAIVDAVAAPVPVGDGAGGWTAATGSARVVLALSGGRIAVVEYTRAADGSIAPGAPVVQEVGFDPLSLAVNPDDPVHVYAATLDPLPGDSGTVEGVAELDATAAPGSWTVRGLDARAPTWLVAAWRLRERLPDSTGGGEDAFEAAEVDRVYAYLDPGSCGPAHPIGCGVAVLDPGTGALLEDPTGFMPYLAPITVPALPAAIVISGPPGKPPSDEADELGYQDPFMRIVTEGDERATTAVAALPSSDGKVYYVDLARWAIPSETSLLLDEDSRTAVEEVELALVDGSEQQLGIWRAGGESGLGFELEDVGPGVTVTPGFTGTESWSVVNEGALPGLEWRPGETGATDGGKTWVALQVTSSDGSIGQVARLFDPQLGVHDGDVVVLATSQISGCADEVEGRVTALVAPDASRPGGAVVVGPPPCFPDAYTSAQGCAVQEEFEACNPALAQGAQGIPSTVRAGGLVVSGSVTGYAGRAELAEDATGALFTLEYKPASDASAPDEDALDEACPLVPWPDDASSVPCDDACRDACERLVLARKARRIHHLSEACDSGDGDDEIADCEEAFPPASYPFPLANGPVIAFRVGLQRDAEKPYEVTARDLGITITTRSGVEPAYRSPASSYDRDSPGGTAPAGAAAFDRSVWPGHEDEGYRFFVPYLDGQVLDFSPGQEHGAAVVVE